jgi:hypothetical protein
MGGEIGIKRKNGEVFPVHLAITAVKDGNGAVTNYVATITGITKRRVAEEELQRYRDELEDTVPQRTAELRLQRDTAEAANKAKRVPGQHEPPVAHPCAMPRIA